MIYCAEGELNFWKASQMSNKLKISENQMQ